MWRPKDWKNSWRKIAEELGCEFPERLLPGNIILVSERGDSATQKAIAFEAGADVMLEALRMGGFFYDGRSLDLNSTGALTTAALMNLSRGRKGMVVFIPDEETY